MGRIVTRDAEIEDPLGAKETQRLLNRTLTLDDVRELADVAPDDDWLDEEDGKQHLGWEDVEVVLIRTISVPPEQREGIDSEYRPVRHPNTRVHVWEGGGVNLSTPDEILMAGVEQIVAIESPEG